MGGLLIGLFGLVIVVGCIGYFIAQALSDKSAADAFPDLPDLDELREKAAAEAAAARQSNPPLPSPPLPDSSDEDDLGRTITHEGVRVTRWRKYGQDRVYVNDAQGKTLADIDFNKRTVWITKGPLKNEAAAALDQFWVDEGCPALGDFEQIEKEEDAPASGIPVDAVQVKPSPQTEEVTPLKVVVGGNGDLGVKEGSEVVGVVRMNERFFEAVRSDRSALAVQSLRFYWAANRDALPPIEEIQGIPDRRERISAEQMAEDSGLESWAKGAIGEVDTAEVLDSLRFPVVHDRKVPGSNSNLDHLVVFDRGVAVIDSKLWDGEIRFEDRTFTVKGFDKSPEIAKGSWQSGVVEEAFAGTPLEGVAVIRIVCFVEADWKIDQPWVQVAGAWALPLENLEAFLERRSNLSPKGMQAAANIVAARLGPRYSGRTKLELVS